MSRPPQIGQRHTRTQPNQPLTAPNAHSPTTVNAQLRIGGPKAGGVEGPLGWACRGHRCGEMKKRGADGIAAGRGRAQRTMDARTAARSAAVRRTGQQLPPATQAHDQHQVGSTGAGQSPLGQRWPTRPAPGGRPADTGPPIHAVRWRGRPAASP